MEKKCKWCSHSNRHFMPGFLRHLLVFHGFPHAQCITQAPQLEHHRTQQDRQRRHRQQRLPLALPQLRARQRPKPLPGSQEPRLGRSPAIERLVCCLMMLNWGQLPTGILTVYFLYLRVGFSWLFMNHFPHWDASLFGLWPQFINWNMLKPAGFCSHQVLGSNLTNFELRPRSGGFERQLVWEANYKVISQTNIRIWTTRTHTYNYCGVFIIGE